MQIVKNAPVARAPTLGPPVPLPPAVRRFCILLLVIGVGSLLFLQYGFAGGDPAAARDIQVVLIAALLIGGYFLPTILGRKKANSGAIFVLNLLLGWTVIGWVAALVWALTVDAKAAPTIQVLPAAAPASPLATPASTGPVALTCKCPDCAETIKAEAHVCHFCGARFTEEAVEDALAAAWRGLRMPS